MNNVTVFEASTLVKRFSTDNRKELAEYKKRAREYASKIEFANIEKDIKHLIYYVELPNSNIYIYERPYGYTDKELDELIKRENPVFVGARHRK